MILLWDVDGGLTQIDKYLYSSEDYIKVGLGIACSLGTSPCYVLVSPGFSFPVKVRCYTEACVASFLVKKIE